MISAIEYEIFRYMVHYNYVLLLLYSYFIALSWYFCRLLLHPLQRLAEDMSAARRPAPTCLMVLDALDESSDGNSDAGPVCSLVSRQ